MIACRGNFLREFRGRRSWRSEKKRWTLPSLIPNSFRSMLLCTNPTKLLPLQERFQNCPRKNLCLLKLCRRGNIPIFRPSVLQNSAGRKVERSFLQLNLKQTRFISCFLLLLSYLFSISALKGSCTYVVCSFLLAKFMQPTFTLTMQHLYFNMQTFLLSLLWLWEIPVQTSSVQVPSKEKF